MSLWEKIKNMFNQNQNQKETDEAMNYLKALPEFQAAPETVAPGISLLATGGPICNVADWKTITRNMVISVEIPLGFARDETQPFEILVSGDQSFLYTRDEMEMKTADIYIESENGTVNTMRCRAEVVKKLLEGEVVFNIIAKGFKAIDVLMPTNVLGEVKLEEKTAFSHTQALLFDETVGYMCKECNTEEQEVVIVINIGNPFIMLPDGTKVEETTLKKNAVDTMTIQANGDTPSFDELLKGMETAIISIPCQVTAQVEVEFIS